MEERIKRLERIVKEQNDDIRALTAVVYEMRQHIPGPVYSLRELPVRDTILSARVPS